MLSVQYTILFHWLSTENCKKQSETSSESSEIDFLRRKIVGEERECHQSIRNDEKYLCTNFQMFSPPYEAVAPRCHPLNVICYIHLCLKMPGQYWTPSGVPTMFFCTTKWYNLAKLHLVHQDLKIVPSKIVPCAPVGFEHQVR